MAWGKNFKVALEAMDPETKNEETMFIMDVVIYYHYYIFILEDQNNFTTKHVPNVDLPIEMIQFIIEKAQEVFHRQSPLVELEAPVKIFGDIHG